MGCKTCEELLAAYNCTANLYTKAMQRMGGLAGEDFRLAVKELERLRAKCQDDDDALTAHYRQHRREVSKKAASS